MRRLIAGLLFAALPAIALSHYYFVRTIADPTSTTSAPVLGTPTTSTQWACVRADGTVNGALGSTQLAVETPCGTLVATDGITRYLEERVTTTRQQTTTTSTRRVEVLGGNTIRVSDAHAQLLMSRSGGAPTPPPVGGGGSFACEDIHNAASVATIGTAVAAADAGDCVVVPPGSGAIGSVSISGIAVICPGRLAGSPSNITSGLITITKHATNSTYLIGCRFTGTSDQHIDIGGDPDNKPFFVHNNHFEVGSVVWADMTTNGGVWSENRIEMDSPNSQDLFHVNLGGPGGEGLASWTAATTFGDDDTTGLVNTYFEDNEWVSIIEITVDCDNGARIAMRHETFTDSSVTMHGGGSGSSGQDTSSYGCRQMEIYDSTFDRSNAFIAVNKWLWARGSSFVFATNVVDEVDSSEFGGKRELVLSVGCPGSPPYPLDYQLGQTSITPDATPNQPALIFGNTGTFAGLINISGESGEGITCGSPSTYIQSGRDYATSNTWGWAGYTYPHPLRPTIDGSGDL